MDKESANRSIASAPNRTVDYRAERQRAGVDVVRVQTPPTQPSPASPTFVAPVEHIVEPRPSQPERVEVADRPVSSEKADKHEEKPSNSRKVKLGSFLRPAVGTVGALLIIGITGYVAFDTYITNNVVRKTTQTTAAVQGDSIVAAEGSDETEVTEKSIKSYVVAADMPRTLTIESIDVKARILPMGVTAKSAIQAPVNIFDAGWYTGSVKPGNPGVTFVDAHASGATRAGLFAYLDTIKTGATIKIEMGDGKILTYKVRETEVKPLADIDMTKVLSPHGNIKEGLTLMTCTGKWMDKGETYDKRAIVYAERVS